MYLNQTGSEGFKCVTELEGNFLSEAQNARSLKVMVKM